MPDSAPLEGVRVVHVGGSAAAAILGQLLADQGADVVWVHGPGDPHHGSAVAVWGRGQVHIPRDDALLGLCGRADVVIDGFAVGAPRRAGFGTALLRARHESLITVELPAFPEEDPRCAVRPLDGVVAAWMAVHEVPLGRKPVVGAIPVPSVLGALYGAIGVLGALIARRRDGRGQAVEVPLAHAALGVQELLGLLTISPPSAWASLQWAVAPFFGSFACLDGLWIYVHFGLPHHVRRLLDALGEDGTELAEAIGPDTLRDPSRVGSPGEAFRIRTALRDLFRRRTAATWEDWLAANGLCGVIVRTGEQWLRTEAALSSGQAVQVQDPELGPMVQPGPPVRVDGTPAIRSRVQGTAAAKLEGWSAARRVVSTPDARPPLAGVRVLDFTQVIAGPVAARVLAELGADVLRVENPWLDAAWVEAFHVLFNTQKRSASLDLATPLGRQRLAAHVESHRPDIVVESFRNGVAEDLGLLSLPGATERVHVSVSCYGQQGAWADRPGWEHLAQAATGMQADRADGDQPDLMPAPINDVCTGLSAAYGALLALFAGGGRSVDAALTATGGFMQSRHLHTVDGKMPERPRGASLRLSDRAGFEETRDGWVWLEPGGDGEVVDAPRRTPREVFADRELRKRVIARVPQPRIGMTTVIRSPLVLHGTPLHEPAPAHTRGSDTTAVFGGEGPQAPTRTVGPLVRAKWVLEQARWAAALVAWRAT